eukprot:5941843-Pyramimonas_sp.AAC.1
MYYAPRRIKWTTSFSYSCQVSRGVLPGCSTAMFLLQLVMMLPFSIFEKSFANTDEVHHSLDIYADDITLQVATTRHDIVDQTVRILQRLAAVLRALDLPIAQDKAKALASDFAIAQQVTQQ